MAHFEPKLKKNLERVTAPCPDPPPEEGDTPTRRLEHRAFGTCPHLFTKSQIRYLSNQNVYHLQQQFKGCCEMIRLSYQWTPVSSHFTSLMKQSSIRQCLSALACISDSVPALHPLGSSLHRPNTSLAYPSGAFAVIFTSESQFDYLFT